MGAASKRPEGVAATQSVESRATSVASSLLVVRSHNFVVWSSLPQGNGPDGPGMADRDHQFGYLSDEEQRQGKGDKEEKGLFHGSRVRCLDNILKAWLNVVLKNLKGLGLNLFIL